MKNHCIRESQSRRSASVVAAADAGARFLTDPPEPVEMRGAFPVYHDSAGRDRYIVLTRAKVPLFALRCLAPGGR
jgi:hypothetical protein